MFTSVTSLRLSPFNSSASSDFLKLIQDSWDEDIQISASSPSSKTFAPSSFRCDRKSWFRLRGSEPDIVTVDRDLDFCATLGTACHVFLQNLLINHLGADWISVEDYLQQYIPNYQYSCTSKGIETSVEIYDPPVKFAVDGIIKLQDRLYLLEIKSTSYQAFNNLESPKSEHIDQVNMYGTLLGLSNVMFIYIDRTYGSLKVYEYHITDTAKISVRSKISHVLECLKLNIPPDRLPSGDKWCSYCPYSVKCKQWG